MSTIPRPPVHRIVILQLGLSVLTALLAWQYNANAAWSALLGGLVSTLPNGYFIWRAFHYRGARHAHNMVNVLYQSAAWKFVLTAVLFALVFSMGWPLNFIALFAGFVMAQLGQMFSSKVINL